VKPGWKPGLFIGGQYNQPLGSKIGIQGEVLIAQKGSSSKLSGSRGKTTLTYLNIPVLFSFSPTERLFLHAGPELGILLSERTKNSNNSADVKKFYENLDKGIAFGANVNIVKSVFINLRFVKGLEGITEYILTDNFGNIIATKKGGSNNSFQIGLTFSAF